MVCTTLGQVECVQLHSKAVIFALASHCSTSGSNAASATLLRHQTTEVQDHAPQICTAEQQFFKFKRRHVHVVRHPPAGDPMPTTCCSTVEVIAQVHGASS